MISIWNIYSIYWNKSDVKYCKQRMQKVGFTKDVYLLLCF